MGAYDRLHQANAEGPAAGPASSLQSKVSHFTESLLSAANTTFSLPQLPPLPVNKTSILPLPWALPEQATGANSSAGLAAEASPPAASLSWTAAPAEAPAGAYAPELAPSGADAPSLAAAPAPAPVQSALGRFPELANPPTAAGGNAAGSSAQSLEAVPAAQGGNTTEGAQPAGPAAGGNATAMEQSKAIGNLVASSVQLGADLAASGHAVSLAAQERASFVAQLKADFEALSLAIADLPVGLIPFPEVAKAALQQLNADVVHGVTSGTLDIKAISADREAVSAALGGLGGGSDAGTPDPHKLV